MFKVLRKYFIPICLAVLVHVVLFSLFFLNFKTKPETPVLVAQPEIIRATSLDESKVVEEVKKLQQREHDKRLAEQKRQQQLEDKRIEEQQKLEQLQNQRKQQAERIAQTKLEQQQLDQTKKQESEKLAQLKQKQVEEKKQLVELAEKKKQLEKKRKKEQERLALLEKKRKDALKKKKQERKKAAKLAAKKKAERTARLKAEAEKRKKLGAERAAAEAIRQGKIISNATRIIMRKVERSWIRPPGTQDGLSATIRVNVIPGGSVKNATVVKSSGNSGFDRSAELAVRKASPLPVPSDSKIFNQFRTFTFNFSPS